MQDDGKFKANSYLPISGKALNASTSLEGLHEKWSGHVNPCYLLHEVTRGLDEGKQIVMSLSSTNHRLFLIKSGKFGIRRHVCQWIEAFLARSKFYFEIADRSPAKPDVTSGVP